MKNILFKRRGRLAFAWAWILTAALIVGSVGPVYAADDTSAIVSESAEEETEVSATENSENVAGEAVPQSAEVQDETVQSTAAAESDDETVQSTAATESDDETVAEVNVLQESASLYVASLASGSYTIEGEILQTSSDATSMANAALESLELAVSGDNITLKMNMTAISGVYLTTMNYQNADGNYEAAEVGVQEDGNTTQWTLPVTEEQSEVILQFAIASIPAMGTQTARLILDWDSVELVSADEEAEDNAQTVYHLSAGTYDIPAEFYHATNEELSSANDAIAGAQLVVADDESATVYLDLQAVTKGEYTLSFYDFQYQGADGEYSDVTLEEGTAEEPTRISFKLPSNVTDTNMQTTYAPTAAFVHTVTVRLRLDFENAELQEEQTVYSLAAGTYDIPAEFYHATNEELSSANDAIAEAQLVVADDESATVYLDLQAVTKGEYTLCFYDFQYEGADGEYSDVTLEEGTAEEPTRISFKLPSNVTDTNMKTTYSPTAAFSHTVTVRLRLDFENAELQEEQTVYSLAAGTYDIPAEFYHATNDALSAANGALVGAQLEVTEDGSATVYLDLQAATQGDYTVNFYNFQYQGTDGTYQDATLEEGTTEAPIRISFELPVNVADTMMQVTYSPYSGFVHTVEVRLRLDFENVVLQEEDVDDGDGNDDGQETEGLSDGNYSIDATILKETSDDLSMADGALTSAQLAVSNGEITLQLNMTDLAGIYVKTLSYQNTALTISTLAFVSATASKTDANGNVTQFSMPVEEGVDQIAVQFTVDESVNMGTQAARLVLDWTSVTTLNDDGSGDNGSGSGDSGSGSGDSGSGSDDSGSGSDDSGSGSDEETTLDKDNLADGIYEVEVDLWHATNNQASMASPAVVKVARIVVSDGNYNMYLYTQPMTLGSITASLQYLQVENTSGGYSQATVYTKSSSGDPTSFTFALPHTNEYVAVKVNPEVAIMGNTYIDARLKLSWDSLKQVSDDTNLSSTPDDSNVSTSSGSSSSSSVKTGDESKAMLMLLLMLGAAVLAVAMKKREFGKEL